MYTVNGGNMETLAKARAIGGSLVVTIPKEIVKDESITEGEMLKIEVRKIKKDWFGTLAGMSAFTKEDELGGHD